MVVSDLELYEILIEKFGKTEAKAITEYIEVKVDKQVDVKTNVLATKHDVFDLKVEITQKMADLEVRLTQKMFVSSVIQFLATVGSIMAIISFMMKK